MAAPVVKLGSLLVRTISKPIGNCIKRAVGYHPAFRGLIIELAQSYHVATTKLQRHVFWRSVSLEIRPLNEEVAVQSATYLLGELLVFSVAGGAILYEVQRSTKCEAKRNQALEMMNQKNEELAAEVKLLKQKVLEMEISAAQTNAYRFWKWREYQNPSFKFQQLPAGFY